MDVSPWVWAGFAAFVTAALAFDLFKHRDAHVIGFREALRWSVFWVICGIGFGLLVWWGYGGTAGAEYTAAYLLEKSLAVDNLFVFALIFAYFKVPAEYQHRVLFWGVIGALVFRAIFLGAGVAVVGAVKWILFLFGAFLLYTAVKLWRNHGTPAIDPAHSLPIRLLRRVVPVSERYDGQKFLTRENGVRVATPLLAVLVAVEATDIVFAIDSVPAVLAVSDDLFIVYTSNALAILGLRALYFCLAGMLTRFRYLSHGLAILLGFIGIKMLLQAGNKYADAVPTIPIGVSLAVIVSVLAGAVLLSLRAEPAADGDAPGPDSARSVSSPGTGAPAAQTGVAERREPDAASPASTTERQP